MRSEMKVLLISFYNVRAYGVRSLHSSLVSCGIDARMLFFKTGVRSHNKGIMKSFNSIINKTTDKEIELFVDFVQWFAPDILAFSIVSSHFSLYKRIYNRIKNIENLMIVIGGWEPSLSPDKCIQYTDYLCIGEGEECLCEMVQKLRDSKCVDNVENLWINKKDNIIRNEVRSLNKDISSLPFLLFDNKFSCFIENNAMITKEPYLDSVNYSTFVSRDCPHCCTYCCNSYMAKCVYPKSWSKPRYSSIKHVMNELKIVKVKFENLESIDFLDEVFTPTVEWSRIFFEQYKKEIDIPFYCVFFPGSCSNELCKILADAGLKGVWLGVQSGSERVRREVFKRYYKNEDVVRQAQIFYENDVNVRYDFIFDNPFETFEESLESIYLMFKLPEPFSLNMFSLKYFPHTEITDMALKAGFITEQDIVGQGDEDQDNFGVGRNNESPKQKFINHMVMYIYFLAKGKKLKERKDELVNIIENFKVDNDILKIAQLLQPFIL